MVPPPLDFLKFGKKAAAEGDVQFLHPAANRKKRDAALDGRLDQRQGHGVTGGIVRFGARVGGGPVALRMHIGPAAGQ